MTNTNSGSSNNNSHEDARHSSSSSSTQPQRPQQSQQQQPKKQALLQRKRQLQRGLHHHQQEQQEREPWLFQSFNFQPSLSLPSLHHQQQLHGKATSSSTSGSLLYSSASVPASALSPSPLLALTDATWTTTNSNSDVDSPFFLDVDSLKRLLPPHSSTSRHRPKSTGSHAYGGAHQNNNNRLISGRQRQHHHQRHGPTRLEALSGLATARRKKLKRKGKPSSHLNSSSTSTTRKYALRMDGIKGRPSSIENSGPMEAKAKQHRIEDDHSHSKAKVGRRSSYGEALAYNSDETDNGDDPKEPVAPLDDLDEEKRQKLVIAAQLNLTLEEYEALDAVFGDQRHSKGSQGDGDDGDGENDDHDGSMTDRYFELFTQYDVDGSGTISPDELRKLLQASGEDMDDAELAIVIQQADTDHDGEIGFDEFVGLMRARKRLLSVANQMGVTGTGPGSRGNSKASSTSLVFSPSSTSFSSLASNSPLPPLKMATLQSKKHMQQFNSHFTRPTPSCLRPGAQVDLTQLRRELAISEYGIQELNSKVREGLHWVQQHCPVRSLKAQIFCHRWGMEKVQQLFLRMQSQALSRAFQKWRAFRMSQRKFTKWKAECLIEARNELHCAAIELQCIIRGKFARLELTRLRQRAAATRMQSLIRGHLARLRVQKIRRAKLEYESASLLQRCYRGYTGKRVARALFRAQREALAVMKIQRAFRNHQRRELLLVIQQTKLEHDSAIKLQCCMRSYLARRERSRRALQKKKIKSSVVIQRHARGLLARRQVHEMKCQEAAATKIQCRFRVFRSCMRVHLLRNEKAFLLKHAHEMASATKIQARWRCFHYRNLYLKERLQRIEAQKVEKLQRLASVMKIQSAYRGYRARRVAQRARYEKLKWMNFMIMNRSALKIQSFWRGYHGRLASHLRLQAKRALEFEENEAAKRIQLIAKGKIARAEKQKKLKEREQLQLLHQKRTKAALKIQKVYRGKKARRVVVKLHQKHCDEAKRALERLVNLTKARAAVKIQCCVRRFLSRVRYLTKQREAERRRQLEEIRLVQEKAALVIQCVMRRAKAKRLLLQRRREFERRISMMASEKAHDEIERLRKEQEEELVKLKLQLMYQQSTANEEAAKLREQVARQREEENQRREAEAEELAKLKIQTLLHQQSERRLQEFQKTHDAERLREKHGKEIQEQEQKETVLRTQENEELTKVKLAVLLETNPQSQKQQQEVNLLQDEAKQLQNAALAMRKEQAKLKIQAICLKYIAKRRIEKLQQAQALQMASLKDEEERTRLKSVQEKEMALARLKAIMDEETRAREQEIKALEMQMLERARVEKERIAKRNASAMKIQSLARGYLGRQRVKAIQDKIEQERDARAKAIEATLAEAEAKVAEALAGDAATNLDDGEEAAAEGEWVEYWDENAQASYFYNTRTQEASWTRPVSAPSVSSKALEIVLTAATSGAVGHDQDSYANYSAEMVDENGYPVGAAAEGYADQYGYYDQYGQYHYYEEDPSTAAAAASAAYSGAQTMGAGAGTAVGLPGMYPGFTSVYAYQAAMASMMFGSAMGFGNPMMQQFANPMMQQQQQQYANPMMTATTVAVAPSEAGTEDAGAPPDPWEKFFDQYTGAAYYYNNITGEKYWA